MNRRQFLKKSAGLTLLVILPPLLTRCGKQTQGSSGDLTVTSDPDATGHTHSFTITAAELAAGAGIAKNDSGSGHIHVITVTAGEMASIAAGGTVTATGSNNGSGHTHTYTLKKS